MFTRNDHIDAPKRCRCVIELKRALVFTIDFKFEWAVLGLGRTSGRTPRRDERIGRRATELRGCNLRLGRVGLCYRAFVEKLFAKPVRLRLGHIRVEGIPGICFQPRSFLATEQTEVNRFRARSYLPALVISRPKRTEAVRQ
jgi:hypothetical protein